MFYESFKCSTNLSELYLNNAHFIFNKILQGYLHNINPNIEDGCSVVIIALDNACVFLMACISPEMRAV